MRRIVISLAVLSLLALVSCQKKIDTVRDIGFFGVPVDIVRVIDGNTFVAAVDGKEEHCRIFCIDTPERGEPWFDEATESLERLFALEDIERIELLFEPPGIKTRDRYGRLLVYVLIWGRTEQEGWCYDAGRYAIKQGLSPYYTKHGKALQDDEYQKAEEEAKKAKRGIWAEGG